MKKYSKGIGMYVVIIIFILLTVYAAWRVYPPVTQEQYSYTTLLTQLQKGETENIEYIEIVRDTDASNAGRATVKFKTGSTASIDILSMDTFVGIMDKAIVEKGINVKTVPIPKPNWFVQLLPFIVLMFISVFLLIFIMQQMQGGGGSRVLSFGKSKAKISADDKNKVTFALVAGLEEEKAELEEIVEFLKQPKKFTEIGARIPKGVLLVGPPGTGKTYLAKAVSGEAGVPFYSISGSDFVEMFVGVGASRVRDLFDTAKKNSPCIVFIDEIDAVGRRRGAGLGGGHDEREQTLNQLLVEMDGFGVNEGVIVMAATNRHDILDPALLRPGRFDRQISVGKPDVKGREAVLKIHSKGKQISKQVDLRVVAQTTVGFTPADLENLLNEAALLAARHDKKEIDMEELRRAFVKVGIGTEKKSRVISEKDRRITAYHEAGHAILHEVLPEIDSTYMISVIPTGWAAGYTMPLPGDDNSHVTKRFMENTIISLLGGRAAEAIVIKDITTGASNDIERATKICRNMVMKFGMSELLGPIAFGDDNDEVFIGRDLAHARNFGEQVASQIDNEIKRIIQDSYDDALRILNEHIDVLHKIAELLMQKEKVYGWEIRGLFPEGVITKEPVTESLMDTFENPDFIESAPEKQPEEEKAEESDEAKDPSEESSDNESI